MSGSPAAALVPRPSLGPSCPSPAMERSPATNGSQTGGGVFRTAMSRDVTSGPPALLQREMSQLSFSSMSALSGEERRGEHGKSCGMETTARCAFLTDGENGKSACIADLAMPMLTLKVVCYAIFRHCFGA